MSSRANPSAVIIHTDPNDATNHQRSASAAATVLLPDAQPFTPLHVRVPSLPLVAEREAMSAPSFFSDWGPRASPSPVVAVAKASGSGSSLGLGSGSLTMPALPAAIIAAMPASMGPGSSHTLPPPARVVLPIAPMLAGSLSANAAAIVKRSAPTFLSSYNGGFAYVHADIEARQKHLPDTPAHSSKISRSVVASPAVDQRAIAMDTLSRDNTLSLTTKDAEVLALAGHGRLGSEPPSLDATPELRTKRLSAAGSTANGGGVGGGGGGVTSPGTASNSPGLLNGNRRIGPSTPRGSDHTPSDEIGRAASNSNSATAADCPTASSRATTGTLVPTISAANANANGLKTVVTEFTSPDPTLVPNAPVEPAPLAPLTWLRFTWLFIIFTICQVTVCCVVVWYLGDRNARSIVSVLSSQIRSEILLKVQTEVTSLLVDCLTAADQLYTTIEAQSNDFALTLATTRSVSNLNVSYLFAPAVVMAKFSTIPQLGYLTPRNIAVAARRPNLLNGYLAGSTHSVTSDCGVDNDGSGGCFFAATPIFDTMLSDPDEPHEYLIQEDTTSDPDAPIMGGLNYTSTWSFNRLEHLRMLGDPEGSQPWMPFHAQSDFFPEDRGLVTSNKLRTYLDTKYAEAVAAGTMPLPNNSSTNTAPPSVIQLNSKLRPTYIDAVLLNGSLGWTRSFLGISNQVLISAVKAKMDATASDGVAYIVFSVLYFNSLNAQILNNLKSTFLDGTSGSASHSEVFVFEKAGLLVATTWADLDATSQLVTRTNILTTDHAFVKAMRKRLVASGLIVATTSSTNSTASIVNVTASNSAASRTYDNTLIDRSFSYKGHGWHLRAAPVSSALGLSWVVIVATLDGDFEKGFSQNTSNTAIFTALVGIGSVLLTLAVVQMLTGPMRKLVNFMEDISWRLLQAKDDPSKQNADFNELRTIWQKSIEKPQMMHGNVEDELADLRRKRRRAIKRAKERKAAGKGGGHQHRPSIHALGGESPQSRSRLSSDSPSLEISSTEHHSDSSASDAERSGASGASSATGSSFHSALPTTKEPRGFWRSLRHSCCVVLPRFITRHLPNVPLQETQLLHRSFAAMLGTMQSSHEMLQTANESKRRFIRYIFHEVRVPFNAIVLGVEQLREDLYTEPLRPVEEMQDVVNILNEQSKVVARILNDVLSLQKIEDGALQLEMQPFNLIEMVCGTLRSFQPLLAEKALVLVTEMENIDQAIVRARLAQSLKNSRAQPMRIEEKDGEQDGDASAPTTRTPAAVGAGSLNAVITPPSLDLATASNGVASYLEAYADSKELQRFADSCSREVLGDRYRLRQVLANMLSNAIKFTTPGGTVTVKVSCSFPENEDPASGSGPEVAEGPEAVAAAALAPQQTPNDGIASSTQRDPTVSTAQQSPGGPLLNSTLNGSAVLFTPPVASSPVAMPTPSAAPASSGSSAHWIPPKRVCMRVSVSDTGRGLSPSELRQLFKAYVQFQSGEQQQGKGTGLGLNISKSLVDLHGGRIGCTSSGIAGQGCTFFFDVPFTIVPLSVSRTSKASSPTHASLQMKRERSASQLMRPAGAAGGTTTSAAASAAAAAFASASDPTAPGLRSWHSPRSLSHRVLSNGATMPGSHQHSPAGPGGYRRSHTGLGQDEHGNYIDLIPDRSAAVAGVNFSNSTPTTPLLARGVFPPAVLGHGRRGSLDGHSPLASAGASATFTSIVPTGTDVTSNLQYMSQLTFLSGLAIQGQGTSSASTSTAKVSPLQQYRSTVLAGQGLPYGVGYSTRPLPVPLGIGTGDGDDVMDDEESLVSPLGLGRSATNLLGLHGHGQRASVTPTTSPLAHGHSSLNQSAPPAAEFSSFAPLSNPTALDETVAGGVFSTSPFNIDLCRTIAPDRSPPPALVPKSPVSTTTTERRLHQRGEHRRDASGSLLALGGLGAPTHRDHGPQRSDGSGTSSSPDVSLTSSPLLPYTPSLAPVASSSVSITNSPDLMLSSNLGRPRPKVLVVEDSVPNRKLLMMLLRALKCDPIGVENGLLAVQEFEPSIIGVDELKSALKGGFKTTAPGEPGTKGTEIGLVLMDGNMPVLDGIHATRAIRALGWQVPITAVTGNALSEQQQQFISAGADIVLTKPVQRAALEKILHQFLPSLEASKSVAQQKIDEARNNR